MPDDLTDLAKQSRPRAFGWLVAHGAVFALAIIPILVDPILPLIDLPNHIARQFIVRNIQALPQLRQFYAFTWALVPNLSMEVFVQALAPLCGVIEACRLYCLTCAGLLYFGTVTLSRVLHGRYSVLPMLAALLIYNGAFLYGFVNYVFGVGLSLFAVAAWIRWRGLALPLHVPVFVAIAILLAAAHLFAFGLFGLAVLGFELALVAQAFARSRAAGLRQTGSALAHGVLPGLVPLVLLAAVSPTTAGLGRNIWSRPLWKAEALVETVVFYFTTAEIAVAAILVATLAVALALRIVRIDGRSVPGLLLLALAFAVMPRTLLSSGYADFRMPSAIALFVLAACRWGSGSTAHNRALVGGLLLALTGVKIAAITLMWRSWQPQLAEYDAVLQHLPAGAVLLVLDGSTGSVSLDRRPPVTHMAAAAVREQAFVPFLFGDEPGFLLTTQPDYLDLRYLAPTDRLPAALDDRLLSYSHVLVSRPDRAVMPAGATYQLLAASPHLQLFSIVGPRS